jgi:hypothetical protein
MEVAGEQQSQRTVERIRVERNRITAAHQHLGKLRQSPILNEKSSFRKYGPKEKKLSIGRQGFRANHFY